NICLPTLSVSSWSFDTPSFQSFLFFLSGTATTGIYTLSLHDALPISRRGRSAESKGKALIRRAISLRERATAWVITFMGTKSSVDRKSTRLNSSHVKISYAVFCLKKTNMSARKSDVLSAGHGKVRTVV